MLNKLYLPLNVLSASEGSKFDSLYVIRSAGDSLVLWRVVVLKTSKKSLRTIVQIIFFFRSFEISQNI